MCYMHAKLPETYLQAKKAMSDELTDADMDKFRLFLEYYLNAFDRDVDPVLWDGCDQLYSHIRWGGPWEWLKDGREAVRKRESELLAEKAAKST